MYRPAMGDGRSAREAAPRVVWRTRAAFGAAARATARTADVC